MNYTIAVFNLFFFSHLLNYSVGSVGSGWPWSRWGGSVCLHLSCVLRLDWFTQLTSGVEVRMWVSTAPTCRVPISQRYQRRPSRLMISSRQASRVSPSVAPVVALGCMTAPVGASFTRLSVSYNLLHLLPRLHHSKSKSNNGVSPVHSY